MRTLLLLVKFVAITAPLTWYWMNGGQDQYMAFFKDVARPFLLALGITNYPPSVVRDRFVGFVPFIGLMLVTPGLDLRRRVGGLLLGLPIIILCQVGLVYAVFLIVVQGGGWSDETKNALFPYTVIFDAVPLILWALFAHEYRKSVV